MTSRVTTPTPNPDAADYTGPRPLVWRLLGVGLLALLLAACASEPPRRSAASPSHTPLQIVDVAPSDPARATDVLMRAIGLIGTPYRYGGNTPETGFDCSGLVNYVYRDMAALDLPRTSRAIAEIAAPKVRGYQLASGDLVFFANGGTVSHIGIYVGDGRFVHAPNSGGTVRLDFIDSPYWREHYVGAKRPLR